MPQLIAPDVRLHASFLEAMTEFAAEEFLGRTLARELVEHAPTWHDPAGFARYVGTVLADDSADTYWYVDGATFLGRILIRHGRLLPPDDLAGHIGCGVRPSARRRGHATGMLRAALPHAFDLGIDPVFVTCDTANTGSRKVIEAAGGVLEGERGGKLRFWVGGGGSESGGGASSMAWKNRRSAP
ncbi:GNAT family N-acetyltransferase [Streptomyces luteolus]|uniref:GNAT family N-acetyltransferase n=1 Tax=Streptomyces luteolus TaxID=3043615 RepID=A0ABT6T7J9_9ACTN|nr:GNAT family N-acetyltransferase [Streptomyces sp. B-S-A12]MDI3423794.1 GNAT family N-acetyltransferase [Streptomyces sp. B-S-A12]